MSARRRAVDPIETKALALDVVRRLGQRRRDLELETLETLLDVYATGVVSWAQIGEALGTTQSVAWHLAHPSGPTEPEPELEEVPTST